MTFGISGAALGALAIGGSAVVGAISANNAANTQASAADTASNNSLAATEQSNALQAAALQQSYVNQSSGLQSGQEALAALTAGLGLNNYGVLSGTNNQYGTGAPATYQTSGGYAPVSGAGIANNALGAPASTAVAGSPGTSAAPVYATPGVATSAGGITAPIGTGYNGSGAYQNGANSSALLPPGGSQSSLLQLNNYGSNTIQNQEAAASQLTSTGQGALQQTFTPSDLTLSPAYQFQLQQGTANLQAQEAASGLLGSGQNLKDITNYGQNAAQTAYQQAYQNFNQNQTQAVNRLQSLAGIGQSAGQNLSNTGVAAGQGIASTTMAGTAASNNYLTGGAAASAAGQVGVANALTGGVNSAIGYNTLNTLLGNNANNAAGLTQANTALQASTLGFQ